jgi:predicted phosphodiesterase
VRFGIEYANRVITPEHRRWLENLPLVWGGKLDKCSVLLSHGSPWRPLDDYLYANNPALDKLLAFDYDLIAFGQTHRPLLIREQRPWRLNPGSVGQSRHRPSQACMALLDTSNMEVSLVERAYDSTNVIKQAGALGAGNWITKHLI